MKWHSINIFECHLFYITMIEITYNQEQLEEKVPQIWNQIKSSPIILLEGPMGAGKTTLVAALAKYVGIAGAVQSPTYALINEYHNKGTDNFKKWIHSDWYRIEDIEEALDTGFEEMLLDPQSRHFIEWSEKINTIIPSSTLKISILKDNETTRTLHIQ